jgi:hypothetical protein
MFVEVALAVRVRSGGLLAIDDLGLVRASLGEVQADGAGNDERVLFIVGKPYAKGFGPDSSGWSRRSLNFSPDLNTVEMTDWALPAR